MMEEDKKYQAKDDEMHKEQLALMKSFRAYLDRSHQPLITNSAPVNDEAIIEPPMTEDHLPSNGNQVSLGKGLDQKQNKVLDDVTRKITNVEAESRAEKRTSTSKLQNSTKTVILSKPGAVKVTTVLSKSGTSRTSFRPNILKKNPITLAQLRTMSPPSSIAASPQKTSLAHLRALTAAKSGNPPCSESNNLAAEALGKKLAAEQVQKLCNFSDDENSDSSEN